MKLPTHPLRSYWLGALWLWVVLVAAFACWAFLAPHPAGFAPEIGVAASFASFGASRTLFAPP